MTSETTRRNQTRWKLTAKAKAKADADAEAEAVARAKAKAKAKAKERSPTNKTKSVTCAERKGTSREIVGPEQTKTE